MMGRNREEISRDVFTLVAECSGVPTEQLHEDMDLADDLGIAGDDGVELMERFIAAFEVNTSWDELRPVFGDEGLPIPLVSQIIDMIRRRPVRPMWQERRRLTIGDLVEAAATGVLKTRPLP